MFKTLFKRHSSGLMVSSTGAVFVPATQFKQYIKPAHWTYGNKNGKYRMVTINHVRTYVHRLVAEAFLTRIPGCDVVDHIDRDPSNNSVFNLRWTTQQGNLRNTESYENARTALGLSMDATPKEVKRAYMHKKYWEEPELYRQKKREEYHWNKAKKEAA